MIYLSSLRGKSMHNRSRRSHDSRSWYLGVLLCETHCRCSWNFNFQRFVTLWWTHIHGDFWSLRGWRYVPFWNKVIRHAPRSIRRHGILRNRSRNNLGNHSPLWFFRRWSILPTTRASTILLSLSTVPLRVLISSLSSSFSCSKSSILFLRLERVLYG